MPRTARSIEAGLIYHVLNRGNGRMNLFHKDADFAAFEEVLAEGMKRYPVELLTYCLMSNHWHLVMRPEQKRGHHSLFDFRRVLATFSACLEPPGPLKRV